MNTRSVTADDGVRLHVAMCGSGPDVLILSGGPGCVQYLANESLAPIGFRSWWIVLGHSWGSDLAVRYALDHPHRVRGIVGIAGHGLHRDREWSAAYEAGKTSETTVEIDWVPDVHAALWGSFKDWIHQPTLWRSLADSTVPMSFVAAGNDIRPSWPLRQLAELVPGGSFEVVPNVPHDYWATDPDLWRDTCTTACRRMR